MTLKVALVVCVCLCFSFFGLRPETEDAIDSSTPMSLCNRDEKVVFSCPLKRTMKIVSLCSSQNFTKQTGYLQYRFGMPGKVELEFPENRAESAKAFKYSHYFRAKVDSTEISFSRNGYTYSVFDDYNGEEKPTVSEQGLTVTIDNTNKELKYFCSVKPQGDYGDLPDVFENSAP